MEAEGFIAFDADPRVARWANAAHRRAVRIASDTAARRENLRHGQTWFVGVDALPNAADGSLDDVPLTGPWESHVTLPPVWHPAQLSIVYPGYPGQDTGESDASHRYRIKRHAAHVDGLSPIGPARRRFLREPHAFVLGLPLTVSDAAPLMVWPGSHTIMGDAFRDLVGPDDPLAVDLTERYQAARKQVFDRIKPVSVTLRPGQSVLLHRHLLHGVAPWQEGATAPPEGRMVAYFRPQFSAAQWISVDT